MLVRGCQNFGFMRRLATWAKELMTAAGITNQVGSSIKSATTPVATQASTSRRHKAFYIDRVLLSLDSVSATEENSFARIEYTTAVILFQQELSMRDSVKVAYQVHALKIQVRLLVPPLCLDISMVESVSHTHEAAGSSPA